MKSFFVIKNRVALCIAAIMFSTSANARNLINYADLFKAYHACFILYNVNENKIVSEYNPNNYCNQ